MDYQEILSYFNEHENAMHYLHAGTDDYIGARVCFSNGLINQGYIFSAQALEKLLKTYILLLDPIVNFRNKSKFPNHNLTSLLTKLCSISDVNINQYQELCRVLTSTYMIFRYPSHDGYLNLPVNTFSTSTIHQVDDMFIQLYVDLPIPLPVKVRQSILGYLKMSRFEVVISHIINNNKAYQKHINFFAHPVNWYKNPNNRPPDISEIKIEP